MGSLSAFFLLWSLAAALPAPKDSRLESKVQTRSGLFERYVHTQDERVFKVRMTPTHGEPEWVEDHWVEGPIDSKTQRVSPQFLGASESGQEILMSYDQGRWGYWDSSTRIYEKERECSALSRIEYPTPLARPEIFILSDLVCQKPLTTESDELLVLGRDEKNQVACEGDEVCWWRARAKKNPEAAAQTSVFTFLWRTEGELMLSGIDAFLPRVSAYSWFGQSNRSQYDAYQKTLFYGAGRYLDGLDGFIVSHEWTHFLIDQLNPGLVGFDGRVLHEAFADFFASNLYQSPCFAPYDAKEIDGRLCVRNLDNALRIPDDLSGRDPYASSLILSGALWEARKVFPPPLLNELLVETVIRLPKKPSLLSVWSLMGSIQKRMIDERELLADTSESFLEIGRRRGLVQQ